MGVPRVKVRADPLMVTHLMSGSPPTWSLVTPPPPATDADPGKVTGRGTLHELPSA